ncbi:uncharacterized protein BP5553_08230 [Venustampulla echinocandica]|uniref:PCI domain-containing protein n=1 Tax=Venustampulla echinocandica TaxID=2656787 RepID=A0A370TG38_9HELO|nr:uncharacterized protein BP5553_08230 [Venustampulla echinocandica]RDL33862.1 hypothetical protein BP5553_08230 [Venustampulla echinocandica]
MNNPGQGSQPAQGQGQPAAAQQQQQNQQRRPQPPLYKPEQMRSLPDSFSANEKEKWEQGLRSLWNQVEKNSAETPQHQEAKRKIFEFSKTLTNKLQAIRMQQQQNAQQGGAARPQSQPQPAQGGEGSSQNPSAEQQQQRQKPQVSAKVMEHVSKFPYVLPPQLTHGTPEAAKWVADAKQRYLKGLVAMEGATGRLAALDAMLQKRNDDGRPLNPDEEKEFQQKKEQFQKTHAEAKNFVDSFRQQQRAAQQQQQQNAANANQQANPAQPQAGGSAPNAAASVPSAAAPARPQVTPQQPNPALQNTQTVNAAIEAARNQQLGGARPSLPQNSSISQAPQMPSQNAPSMPQQGPPTSNIKMESAPATSGISGMPPQINTGAAVTQLQQGQSRPMQNSPQSAVPHSAGGAPQSATSQAPQVPRALTHSAALTQAARSYSSGNTGQPSAPHVMGHSHPSAPREAQNVITNKMPIPKHLPERATAPPQPVPINQPRPTYTGGPSNAGTGVVSQPVLPKTPGYNMAGEGDRVLSRKKLDELVKQVTGGGQGDGQSLTPEVEESMLTVADTFVDQVLHAACKIAKERGSKVLEIRDIQLTLERGYNIRIPGYSSDEIRTVRKIQPSPAWIAKMSAVQAAKVTGGKNADDHFTMDLIKGNNDHISYLMALAFMAPSVARTDVHDMGAWITVVAFPSRSRSSFNCNHPRQLVQDHHPSPSTTPTTPCKGPNTGYFPEDQTSQKVVFKSDTLHHSNHTTLTRSPTASLVRHQGRRDGRCADDMPSKTPHTNGNDPVENGINGTKDVEMKDDAPAPLKGGKGKKVKEGDEEMTVVVPPSKGSKLSSFTKKDNDGDVAMGEEETSGEDGAVKVDPVAKAVSDIKNTFPLLERAVTLFDARFSLRALRSISSIRKRLTPDILSQVITETYPSTSPGAKSLLVALERENATFTKPSSNEMDVDVEPKTSKNGKKEPKEIIPEIDIFLGILIQIYYLDNHMNQKGAVFSQHLAERIHLLNRRTLDSLSARVYFYYSLFCEQIAPLPPSLSSPVVSLRPALLGALRTAVLRKDIDTQSTVIVLLLRNYISTSSISQADLLVSHTKFPENASNNQVARYLYYLGRIRAIQLRYTEAHEHFTAATRKAPSSPSAAGFSQNATKFLMVVELLMGDIPERAIFRAPSMEHALQPYFQLVQAVRVGLLGEFENAIKQHSDTFRRDGTYTLILRLRQNVIKTGIRMMSLSYSRISLRDICIRLKLDSEESAEYIVAKAIRDGVIEASLDRERGFMKSKEVGDVYATREPGEAFHDRIRACLALHDESVKAMRFPMNQHRLELKNAQEAREREREMAKEIQDGDLDEDDLGGDFEGM